MQPEQVSKWLARFAVGSFFASIAMYLWGAFHLFAWDIEELCTVIHHQDYDARYSAPGLIPLARKCNAHFDLIPSYVNPAVLGLAIAAVVLIIAASVAYLLRDPAGDTRDNAEASE
jgi:hypothetical protein